MRRRATLQLGCEAGANGERPESGGLPGVARRTAGVRGSMRACIESSAAGRVFATPAQHPRVGSLQSPRSGTTSMIQMSLKSSCQVK
jgi:hypothetical protein